MFLSPAQFGRLIRHLGEVNPLSSPGGNWAIERINAWQLLDGSPARTSGSDYVFGLWYPPLTLGLRIQQELRGLSRARRRRRSMANRQPIACALGGSRRIFN